MEEINVMLFDTNEYNSIKIDSTETCLHCKFRERWQCGNTIIQYCGKRTSNRTDNGKLKIKCKTKACNLFEKNK